jgi:5-methyltetrahydrofolate--homocysteine methyltransferase
MSNNIGDIKEAVVSGKHKEIESLVKASINEGTNLNAIINNAMIAAMNIVGQKFVDNEIYIPEMLASGITMKKGLSLIKPLLKPEETEANGAIIMCTVKGDLHDIGKNLVIMMLEGAGYNVIDLGVDVTVEKMIQQVKEIKPDILGLSALLTTTMPEMKKVIEAIEDNGLRKSVKVMVGGATLDTRFAEEIGADGYGKDAAEAVKQARMLIARE